MKQKPVKLVAALASAAMLTLAGCGGGSGDPTPRVASNASLSGTAAVGAPLPNAKVTLKDSTGKTLTATADANGAYSFPDVSGLTAPLMLQASGAAGGVNYTLHSLLATAPAAGVSGVINVTPATDAVVAQTVGGDPAVVFSDAAKIRTIDPVKLDGAKKKLVAALADVLKALGQDSKTVDLFTTAFAANNAGLDKLLDAVSFSHEKTGTDANFTDDTTVHVTDKATGVVNDIKPADKLADVKKVIADEANLTLDTTQIKAFLAAFNAQAATQTGLASDAMRDLFDVDYLDNGRDRVSQLTGLAQNGVGMKMLDYVIKGCEATTKVCKGDITLKQTDDSTETFAMPVILGTDGKWRAYGNRSPFKFDLKPVVTAQNSVDSNGAATPSTPQTGLNLWFTGKVGDSRTYNTAKLFISYDDGATWSTLPIAKLKANSSCAPDSGLPLDNGSGNCGNFKPVGDTDALAANQARAQGKLKFKIVAFTDGNYGGADGTLGTKAVYVTRIQADFWTASSGSSTLANSGLGITASELGTSSVSFTGVLDSLNIGVTTNFRQTGNTGWDRGNLLKSLNGKATVAAANALCVGNGTAKESCDASYGSTAVIQQINLSKRDSQGRGIWVNYYRSGGGGSSSASASVPAPISN